MHSRMGAVLALALGAWLATPVAPAQADDPVKGDHEKASGECTIVGTPGPDVLRGTKHADFICGLGGDDKILGRGGDDVLQGGGGDDLLIGGPGNDVLGGGRGDDTLNGLDNATARDKLRCGRGDDTALADPHDVARPRCEHVQQDDPPTDLALSPAAVAENSPGGSIVGTLTATDPDPGDSHTFTLVPGTGSDDNGSFTVVGSTLRTAVALDHETTPTQSVRVRATDSGGLSVEKALTVTVTDADDPPVAVADTKTVTEDAPATPIDVLANDTDADGGPMTVQSVAQPAHGAVVIQAGGTGVTYAPAANYCNTPAPPTDDFTYTLNGGSTASVKVTVTCVDDPAVANDDARIVAEDSGATVLDVLANDTDVEGDPFSVTAVTQPVNGTTTFTAANVSYTPDADYCNNPPPFDTFIYTVTGGDTATVSVTVTCVNDPPVAVDDIRTTAEDTALVVSGADLAANDTDADGDPLTVTAVSNPTGGTVVLAAGTVTFTPAADLCNPAPAGFDYTVSDGNGGTDTGHVDVSVTCVNDPPLANDDTATVSEDAPATTVDVLANDTDVESDPITVTGVGAAAHGTTGFTAADVTYTPDADFCGSDSFDYTVNGGDTATVSVTVTCVNDAPVVDLDTTAGGTGSSATFQETDPHTGTGVLVAPNTSVTDIDDAELEGATITLTNRPDGGAESLSFTSPAGSGITGTYAPATGVLVLSGTASKADYTAAIASTRYDNTTNPPDPADRTITVTVNDGDADSSAATATVQVVRLNVPPVNTVPGPQSTAEDTPLAFSGASAVTVADPDNASLDVEVQVTHGVFTLSGTAGLTVAGNGTADVTLSGTLADLNAALDGATYTPAADYNGPAQLTITSTDAATASDTDTVAISVTPVNDAPTATNLSAAETYTEDTPLDLVDIVISDVDSTDATATLTLSNPAAGSLSTATSGTVTSTYNPGTGTWTASGPITSVNTLLAGVVFTPAADFDASFTIATSVTDGAGAPATGSKPMTGTPVNDPPVVDLNGAAAGIDSSAAFTEDSAPANPGSGPAALASNATVTDVDNANLSGATITLTNHPDAAAESLTVNTAGTTITAVYTPGTGVLALSGTDTTGNYQQVIRTLSYNNTSNTPNTAGRDVTVRVTDPGALDSVLAHASVSVTATNDAPVAVADTFNGTDAAVGNTPLAVGTTQGEPRKAADCTVAENCSVLTRGTDDSDPDGPGPLVVGPTGPQAITTADGGKVTLEADGNFTYFPKAGTPSCADTSDSFTYTLDDQGTNGTSTGTVTIALTGCVWYVDSSVAGPGTGTGSDPFKTLGGVNGAGGAGDADGAGDTIMIMDAASYAGGLPLENNQLLRSKRAGLAVGSATIVTAAGASNPTISNAAGNALTLASGNTVQGIDLGATPAGSTSLTGTGVGTATMNTVTSGAITNPSGGAVDISTGTVDMRFGSITSTNATGDGIRLDNIAGTFIGSGGSLQNAGGQDVDLSGDNAGDTVDFTYDGTITDDVGTVVSIANQNNGLKDFNGLITDGDDGDGSGISLTNNPVATMRFDGGVILSTGSNAAFAATGGGTVVVNEPNGVHNSLTTTTGTALNVANTAIGADGLHFTRISANGATNGVVLNNTGSTAGLTVSGNAGACSSAATCTGGAILNTTNAVSLTNTRDVSIDRMFIQNSVGDGITGTTTTNFSLTNSRIDNSGTGLGAETSNIGFNTTAAGTENNLSGTVTITGNTLTNAYYHGIDIFNFNGTISNATISNNTITSSTSTATSKGTGVRLVAFGSAGTVANVTQGLIDNNTISNFPSANGILASGGNGNAAGPAGTFGTVGSGTNVISITNNDLTGNPKFGAFGIGATVNGKGQGNVNVSGNSVHNTIGTAISVGSFGFANLSAVVNNNTVVANNTVGAQGIGAGTSQTFAATDTPTLTITATGNTISQTDGNGILVTARDATGKVNATIKDNNVAAPLGGIRPGIRVDAANTISTDDAVCLDISGNTSAGSGGSQGIGLRKQGTVTTTNDFGVEGMAATGTPGVESFVSGQNPAGNGTLLISALSGFSNCNTAP
ncbi:MAG TPA: Ig-like domain-containing protein [Nocardioides sp.]|uniref:Ig-like domain-containing protein n=1 Tax=Nocardioides sp. TaxID=35761 RepID=UPI002E31C9BC|nr:Ig-like domain-containing protein [Nocardioides sp.]HEX5087257.1 Ig-like domain-containing protein [Nocardioides sp.]